MKEKLLFLFVIVILISVASAEEVTYAWQSTLSYNPTDVIICGNYVITYGSGGADVFSTSGSKLWSVSDSVIACGIPGNSNDNLIGFVFSNYTLGIYALDSGNALTTKTKSSFNFDETTWDLSALSIAYDYNDLRCSAKNQTSYYLYKNETAIWFLYNGTIDYTTFTDSMFIEKNDPYTNVYTNDNKIYFAFTYDSRYSRIMFNNTLIRQSKTKSIDIYLNAYNTTNFGLYTGGSPVFSVNYFTGGVSSIGLPVYFFYPYKSGVWYNFFNYTDKKTFSYMDSGYSDIFPWYNSTSNPDNLYLSISACYFIGSGTPLIEIYKLTIKGETGHLKLLNSPGTAYLESANSNFILQNSSAIYLYKNTGNLISSYNLNYSYTTPESTKSGLYYTTANKNMILIFDSEGTLIGSYSCGDTIRDVDIAYLSGLFATAVSDDGFLYIFSKDSSSSWYLFDTLYTDSPITHADLSSTGLALAITCNDNTVKYYTISTPAEETGFWYSLYVYKNSAPYRYVNVDLYSSTDGSSYSLVESKLTDGIGKVVFYLTPGVYYRFDVNSGEASHTELATETHYSYTLYISPPRLSDLTYSATPVNQTCINLDYYDASGLTTAVTWKIINTKTQAVIWSNTSAAHSTSDTVILPGAESYRVELSAARTTGEVRNVWYFTAHPISPQIPVSEPLRSGLFLMVLMIIGGLFSYLSSTKGALIVALICGLFVLMGWIMIPWWVVSAMLLFSILAGFASNRGG